MQLSCGLRESTWRLLPAFLVLALCSCASAPDSFEAVHNVNAQAYADSLARAVRDRKDGKIGDDAMAERIRTAADALAKADVASARDIASAAPTAPMRRADEEDNGCLLISCPKSSQGQPASEPVAPAPNGTTDGDANKKPAASDADKPNACLIIRC